MSVEKNYEMTKKMIIGEGLEYDLNCYQTKRNNNVVVIGGAGERVIIVIPHGSAVNTRASAA